MSSAFSADEHSYASPAVWGAENGYEPDKSEEPGVQPAQSKPTVFIPAASEPDEYGHAEIQLRRTDEGELALPVFTSVENLVTCCGEDQAWVAFSPLSLSDLLAATGADGIAQDVELPQTSVGGS